MAKKGLLVENLNPPEQRIPRLLRCATNTAAYAAAASHTQSDSVLLSKISGIKLPSSFYYALL